MTRITRARFIGPVMSVPILLAGCDGLVRFQHESFVCSENRHGLYRVELQQRSGTRRLMVQDETGERELPIILFTKERVTAADDKLEIQLNRQTNMIAGVSNQEYSKLTCQQQKFEM